MGRVPDFLILLLPFFVGLVSCTLSTQDEEEIQPTIFGRFGTSVDNLRVGFQAEVNIQSGDRVLVIRRTLETINGDLQFLQDIEPIRVPVTQQMAECLAIRSGDIGTIIGIASDSYAVDTIEYVYFDQENDEGGSVFICPEGEEIDY